MANMLDNILNTIIDNKVKEKKKHSEWYGLSSQERAVYLQEANKSLFDIQQTSLNVLAAQYFEMKNAPVSVAEHLSVLRNALAEVKQRIDEVGSTTAREYYKKQLEGDISIYERQLVGQQSYESSWHMAAKMLEGKNGDNATLKQLYKGSVEKKKTLSKKIGQLQMQLNKLQEGGTANIAYIKAASELAAYKDLADKYNDFVAKFGTPAAKDPRVVPAGSDSLPLNASLLLMEERPGYIRMNIALVDANYDASQKEMFLNESRKIVIQSRKEGGDINFSFGTAARSLAWHQNYRLNPQPGGTPTYAPIRSVLVKTEFVRKYFGSYMESEHSQRYSLKVRVTDYGKTMKLVNVDRKIPNQVGVTVDLDGSLQDIINQNADVSSFQTIASSSYRDTQYDRDRDGDFVSIEDFERKLGFRDKQYLLELAKKDSTGNIKYLPATPFALIEQEASGKFVGGHLSKSETEELYTTSQAFFAKLEQLHDGTAKDEAWYRNPVERDAFTQQLTRLLDRNHITPASLLIETGSTRENRRDASGNSYNKVEWENEFARRYLENPAVKDGIFDLSDKLVKKVEGNEKLIDRALSTGYVLSDLGAARQQMRQLLDVLLAQEQTAEQVRVDTINRHRDPRDPRVEVYDERNVRRRVDKELLLVLLDGPDRASGLSVKLATQQAIRDELSSVKAQALRTQLLFHVLRPMAEALQTDLSEPAKVANKHLFDSRVSLDDADKVLIGNRVPVVDAYRLLNTDPKQIGFFDGSYVISDDKQRSYNQYQPDRSPATTYMAALDIPFTGGISGTTRVVSSHLTSLFGSLTLKQYWQFQLANAALMIRNGYHSFFEAIYVAARYEPQGEGAVGPQLLDLFDTLKAAGEKGFDLKGQLYTETMKLVMPIVEDGVTEANRYRVPEYARLESTSMFDETLQRLGDTVIDRRRFDTLQERIDLVKDVYQRLTREKALEGQSLTPGFEQLTPTELNSLDLEAVKRTISGKIDDYLQLQKNAGHRPPASLTNEQKTRIAELAVEGIVRQDINKRAELLTCLNELGFSMYSKNGADRLLAFWSDEHEGYKIVLNNKLAAQGKPGIATDFDVTALDFVHRLRAEISGFVKASNPEESLVVHAVNQGSVTMAGFLSSVYAASTAELGGTVYVMSRDGLKINNSFWNVELPVLRSLQKAGAIGDVRILHEPFENYMDKPLEEIGSLLTANDVGVKANYNYLPKWLVEEKFAAMHKQWVDTIATTNLVALHKELQKYIDEHPDSGRISAMRVLLQQTNNKLLELNEFDGMTATQRIDAAREAPTGNNVTLWSVNEMLERASVPGKKRGESYQRIMSLLEQVNKDSKPMVFHFPDASRQSPYITLKFHGDVIDNYSEQLKRLLPFNLLRETWGVVVTQDGSTGELMLSTKAGGECRIRVAPASTIEQKVEQNKQIAALERFLLANFTSKDLPAQLSYEGEWIKSGAHKLAQRVNGSKGFIWRTDQAEVALVRTAPKQGNVPNISPLKNRDVQTWFRPEVIRTNDDSDTRYDAQIIIQTENDHAVAKAAGRLTGKHPDNSILVQLAADGSMQVVYGDISLFNRKDLGALNVRWQIVGHGRTAENGTQTLGGLSAGDMVKGLRTLTNTLVRDYGVEVLPSRISLVGCSLGKDSGRESFGEMFTRELATSGLEISVRISDLAIDEQGRKRILNEDGSLVHKAREEKLILQWQEESGEIILRKEMTDSALLVGRDNIDVAQLFRNIQEGRQSLDGLSAAQQYALSQFYPDEHGQLDRLGLEKNVVDADGYVRLQSEIHDLGINALRTDMAREINLRTALLTLDVEKWGEKYYNAIARLTQENNLENHWMPVIANTEDLGKGQYRLQFINRNHSEETRWVNTEDVTFVEFRRFMDERLRTISSQFSLEKGQLHRQYSVGDVDSIDGLNAGFALQSLIEWFANKSRENAAEEKVSSDLATALTVHCYLNYTQMAHQGAQDAVKITELVRTALRGEVVAAETSLMQFSSTLAHVANEGFGLILNGAMVGLDIYELAHAESETEKAVFGTQLAFDSAGFITGVAATTAGFLGASSIAAVLSGPTVIIAGLGISFTALAQAYGAVADDAKAVGKYFDMLDKAYKGNGYKYDNDHKLLKPLSGAVVRRLNLRKNQIELDSQYIYRTHHAANIGSGRLNYFVWGGEPNIVHDRSQAIEVRSGIGYKDAVHNLDYSKSDILILPGTPKSYINYEYQTLPGATSRGDTGFNVLRRLEKDYRFDYDFYVFPSEYIVRLIHQEYVDTPVEVILGQRNRQLVMPVLPSEFHNFIRYEVKGAGGEYQIVLNHGSTIKLMNNPGDAPDNAISRWILDSSQLSSEGITVSGNQLNIGGVIVHIDSTQNAKVLIVNKQGEVREVDFTASIAEVVSEDASRWLASGQSIEQHLKEFAKTHKLHGQYTVVENYQHNGRNVGQAYYDVANDRMLFSDVPAEKGKNARLGAVIGGYAYFFDAENATVWRVDIPSGKVDTQFVPWFNQNTGKIRRLWQDGDSVYLTRQYQLKDGEAELSYQLIGDRIELAGVTGNAMMLQRLARSDQQVGVLEELLDIYKNQGIKRETPTLTMGGKLARRVDAELITVFGKDAAGVSHRYWIRRKDGKLIKPNLALPAGQTLQSEWHGKPHSAWPIPEDLVLAGSMVNATGTEVFYFYSKEQKVVFRQEGFGQKVLDADYPSALRLNIPVLANLIHLNGSLVAVTEDGRVANLDANGELHYGAVNEHWLKRRAHWWQDLASVADENTPLAVFGVKDTDGIGALAVWYQKGQVVIAPESLKGKNLQFLGFDADGSGRIFEPESGKFYLQPAMTERTLADAFGSGYKLDATMRLPVAKMLFPETPIKSVSQVADGLRILTMQGELLQRTNNGLVQLLGVNAEWQQNNQSRLVPALSALAARWHAQGVISLLDKEEGLGWYDISSGSVFSGQGIPASDTLNFVGVSEDKTTAFVFSATTQTLYKVDRKRAKSLGHFTDVKRIGSTLLIQGELNGVSLVIDGVDNLVLHGGSGDDTYRMDWDMWQHYSKVVIDNEDPEQSWDRVILPQGRPNELFISRHNEDLQLRDSVAETSLVIRQVFGPQGSAYQHLIIEFPDNSPDVASLVRDYINEGHVSGESVSLEQLRINREFNAINPQRYSGEHLNSTNLLRQAMSGLPSAGEGGRSLDNVLSLTPSPVSLTLPS